MRTGRVIIASTLDIKGEEIKFLNKRLHGAGIQTAVIDVGILRKPILSVDVDRERIAKAAG